MDPIVEVLESAMAVQDPYTVGHQQRVAHISLALAREMGLEEQQIGSLEIAARLHDFGKISVPMGILSKRGRLSGHEMATIKRHPVTGVHLLKPLPLPPRTFLTIMQHHERINGSGYPFGLTGEDILLEAKILGVADVVEAIASRRPYRHSLGIECALREIHVNKGILYDAPVVNALTKLYAGDMVGGFLSPAAG
jgi:HD-GYP domain-containing protein (c-di-GMP phosphodiesterase class II)